MRYFISILIPFALLMLGGCRTNNGEIGELYGQWYLQEMTTDGEKVDFGEEEYYWCFQNNIIFIETYKPHHDRYSTMGTWERDDDVLILNFTHMYGGLEGSENWKDFNPPAILRIPGKAITDLDIRNINQRKMELERTDSLGVSLVYRLEKLK